MDNESFIIRILAGLITTLGFFTAYMLEKYGEETRYHVTLNLIVFLLSGASGFIIVEAYMLHAQQQNLTKILSYHMLLSVLGFGLGSAILPYVKEFALTWVIYRLKNFKLDLELEYDKHKLANEEELHKAKQANHIQLKPPRHEPPEQKCPLQGDKNVSGE